MKSCSHFQQAGQPAANLDVTFGGVSDAGHDLQQRALARAVTADDADHITRIHIEANIAQSPEALFSDRFLRFESERLERFFQMADQYLAQIIFTARGAAQHVFLRNIAKFENRFHQMMSANRRSMRRKMKSPLMNRTTLIASEAQIKPQSAGPPSNTERNPITTPVMGFSPSSS